MEALQEWATKSGAAWPLLTAEGRSVYTATGLTPGDMLMHIPSELLLIVDKAFQVRPFCNIFRLLAKDGASERTLLCLFLAMERAKGVTSFWWPYIQSLPQTFTTPLWFNEEERAALGRSRVAAGIKAEKKALENLVHQWGRSFLNLVRNNEADSLGRLATSDHLRDEDEAAIRWRHCPGDITMDPSHAAHRPGDIPGDSSQAAHCPGDTTWGPKCEDNEDSGRSMQQLAWAAMSKESLLWARSVVFSRAFTLRWGARHVIALVPMFDMLDHSPMARLTWLTDEAKGVVTFSTNAPLASGASVYNNYGQKPNEELLQGYGFALPDNPAECFVVKLGFGSQPNFAQDYISQEERAESTFIWRWALLERLGVSREHRLSVREPLPRAFLEAARILAMPERTAYACLQKLDARSETGPCTQTQEEGIVPHHPYLELKVVRSLKELLSQELSKLPGGSEEDERNLLDCIETALQSAARSSNRGEGTVSMDASGLSAEGDRRETFAKEGSLGSVRTAQHVRISTSEPQAEPSDHLEPRTKSCGPSEAMKWVVLYRLGQKQVLHAAISALERIAAEVVLRSTPIVHEVSGHSPKPQYTAWCAEKGVRGLALQEIWPMNGPDAAEKERPIFEGHSELSVLHMTRDASPGDCLAYIPRQALLTEELPRDLLKLLKDSAQRREEREHSKWKRKRDNATEYEDCDNVAKNMSSGILDASLCSEKGSENGHGKADGLRFTGKDPVMPSDVSLAIRLMWERALGTQSQHKAFVDMLVTLPETAFAWDDRTLEGLGDLCLHDTIANRLSDGREQYEAFGLKEAASGLPSPLVEAFSEERFLWALRTIDRYAVQVRENVRGNVRENVHSSQLVLAPLQCLLPPSFVGSVVELRWGIPQHAAETPNPENGQTPSSSDSAKVSNPPGNNGSSQGALEGNNLSCDEGLKETEIIDNSQPATNPSDPGNESLPQVVYIQAACALKAGTLLLSPLEGLDTETQLLDFGCDSGPSLASSHEDRMSADVIQQGLTSADVNPSDACILEFVIPEEQPLRRERCKLWSALGCGGEHYLGSHVEPSRLVEALAVAALAVGKGTRFKSEEANALLAAYDTWQAAGQLVEVYQGTDEGRELAQEREKQVEVTKAALNAAIASYRTYLQTSKAHKEALSAAVNLVVGIRENLPGNREGDEGIWREAKPKVDAIVTELRTTLQGSYERKVLLMKLKAQKVLVAVHAYRFAQKTVLDRWIDGLNERNLVGKESMSPQKKRKKKKRMREE